jgi:hypothetical protein
MGHMLAIGLPEYLPGIHRLANLRKIADEHGAYLIAAHPFRHWMERSCFLRQGKEAPELDCDELAKLPVFEFVDAIEVFNGCNTSAENRVACQVANRLGKPGMAGSDCHSESGVGKYVTVFERHLLTQQMMVRELHAGRFAVYNEASEVPL